MYFSELAKYFERLEGTASRLAMTEVLAELFKVVSEDEIPVVVNLSLGQLRPKFDRLEFNLAEKMAVRALAEAAGLAVGEVRTLYKNVGDMGETWIQLRQNSKFQIPNSKLSVLEVYEKLVGIAEDGGQGSQERKVHVLSELLKALDPVAAKYVARMVVGKLRLGFSDMTILDGLSWMETGDKSKRKELENAYQLAPDVGELAKLVKQVGADKAEEKVEVKLGVPVIPALAQRLKTADEMIEKMGKVAVEPKYDGTRVQIHYQRKVKSKKREVGPTMLFDEGTMEGSLKVRTFTRNLDETTPMFPEVQRLPEYLSDEVEEVILDSEAVGIDPVTGKMMAFQETIQRKRKHGVAAAAKSIPLTFFVFDVLYLNGKSLVKVAYHERREILERIFKGLRGKVKGSRELVEIPEMIETEDADELRRFHARQLKGGLEGALVKKWDGIYEPGRRGWSWVKFKEAEDSAAKLSDTVDAVVMGMYVGKGKRTGFGVGAFLIGIRGDDTRLRQGSGEAKEGKFYTISKVGTGLTDEQWRELKGRGERLKVKDQPREYEVGKNLAADVWLAPGLVVEIAADEVTKSPMHTAGLALRFPRLVRFRDDKGSDEVTSVRELGEMAR